MLSKEAITYFEEANYCQFKVKKYERANDLYLKAIEMFPNYIEALNNCAQNLRLNIRDYERAIIYYSKVIEIKPTYESVYFRRGLCKKYLKDYTGQVKDYSRHIEINKPNSDLFISRAIVNFKLGIYQDVIEDCMIALSLNNENNYAKQLITKATNKLDEEKSKNKINK